MRLNGYLVVENQVLNVGFNDFIKTSSIFYEIMIQGPESFKVDGFKCLTAQFADIGECQLKSLNERCVGLPRAWPELSLKRAVSD